MRLTDIDRLSPELLKKAVLLKNCTRKIFVALCNCNEPKSSTEIAKLVGESRAYVNMRLNQLVELNLATEIKVENHKSKEKLFVVVK